MQLVDASSYTKRWQHNNKAKYKIGVCNRLLFSCEPQLQMSMGSAGVTNPQVRDDIALSAGLHGNTCGLTKNFEFD